jgi:hypothetical protein
MIDIHDSDDDRLNLSALDPDNDPRAADRFVNAVMTRIATRPKPESPPADPLFGVWTLVRSPLLAAGIVIAAGLGTYGLARQWRPAPQNVAQAIGVPAAFLADAPPSTSNPDRR